MNELKVTKEKVLAAAKKCSQAKEVLKEMFPEVFEDDKYFDLSKLRQSDDDFPRIFTNKSSIEAGFNSLSFFQIRDSGEYENKAFFLNNTYNWEIKEDGQGVSCLIPTKK